MGRVVLGFLAFGVVAWAVVGVVAVLSGPRESDPRAVSERYERAEDIEDEIDESPSTTLRSAEDIEAEIQARIDWDRALRETTTTTTTTAPPPPAPAHPPVVAAPVCNVYAPYDHPVNAHCWMTEDQFLEERALQAAADAIDVLGSPAVP